TIEFIMDEFENFYFIEMNTRIQVEHPISEQISGIDIIKEQLSIASNKELSFKQDDIKINGHAIEVRINAEDAYNNFTPSCGKIDSLYFPTGLGIRIESFIYHNYVLLPYYDSMLAKVIVHGRNRKEALAKITRSLEEIDIEGIKTNIDFQLDIVLSKAFINGKYNTNFVSLFLEGDIDV
ncbi:MAG: acetyl-CoA carboxylase biotin carboxylase subunit, partial [Erysipelotrichales bacterium]